MSDWPAADGPLLRRLSVGEALRDAVRAAADVTALVEGAADPPARRRWTYRELLAEAERTAAALLGRFSAGERVAIWANNLPEWVLLEYGAALAGITIVTINPALRGGELRHVLANSGAQGLFMLPGYRGTDMRATLAGIRAELPRLREVVLLTEWDEFLSSGRPGTDLSGAGPDDPAQIQYTSGTTGAPKGAVLRHAGITDNAALYAQRAGLRAGDVTVNPMPLFHTAGCVMSVLGTLSVRGTLVLPPAFDPALQLRLLEEEQGTSMIGVPTMLIAMLDAAEFRSADLSSLRCVVSGGAVVPAELVRRIERETPALVSIVFAQTESSPVITQTSPHDSADDRAETLGRPLPHTAVRIVNPRTGQTLPVGETGELLTRGYGVMLGYNNDPAATAAAIDSGGWLHTGDLAKMDERGYVRIDGRLKEMIIRGGENIYPREIEAVLFGHPDVADAAVVGIPDERWENRWPHSSGPPPGTPSTRPPCSPIPVRGWPPSRRLGSGRLSTISRSPARRKYRSSGSRASSRTSSGRYPRTLPPAPGPDPRIKTSGVSGPAPVDISAVAGHRSLSTAGRHDRVDWLSGDVSLLLAEAVSPDGTMTGVDVAPASWHWRGPMPPRPAIPLATMCVGWIIDAIGVNPKSRRAGQFAAG